MPLIDEKIINEKKKADIGDQIATTCTVLLVLIAIIIKSAPVWILCLIIIGIVNYVGYQMRKNEPTKDELNASKARLDAQIICPQCQIRGFVSTHNITTKNGIHGGKATAALLTGGTSMLLTGLSQEEEMTQAHCSNCGTTWRF
jgi:hypothetical protein